MRQRRLHVLPPAVRESAGVAENGTVAPESTRPRAVVRRRPFPALWACAILAAGLADGAETHELTCTLAPRNAITTFVLAGPFPREQRGLHDQAVLNTPKAGQGPWQLHCATGTVAGRGAAAFGSRRAVDLRSMAANQAGATFYAACDLHVKGSGTVYLQAVVIGTAEAWVDGRQVLKVSPSPGYLSGHNSTPLRLNEGRHRLFLRITDQYGDPAFSVNVVPSGDVAVTHVTLPSARPVDAGKQLAQSCTIAVLPTGGTGAARGVISKPGQSQRLALLHIAGRPVLDADDEAAPLKIRFDVRDPDGRMISLIKEVAWRPMRRGQSVATPQIPLKRLSHYAAESTWMPTDKQLNAPGPAQGRSAAAAARAWVDVQAKLLLDKEGKQVSVGEKARRVYLVPGLRRWADSVQTQIAAVVAGSPHDCANARLAAEKARLRLDGWTPSASECGQAAEDLKDALAFLEVERRGQDPLADRRGFTEPGFVSAVDDSVQPYQLFVPPGAAPAEGWPVVVFLHGYVPTYHKHGWLSEMPQMNAAAESAGVILLRPFGRSNTDFLTVGETDVIEALEDVCARYAVDRSRISLLGYSMGGSGVYTLAAHYPDRWSAAVAMAGRTDYYLWHDLDRADVPPWKRQLIDMDNAIDQVENLRHVPVRIFHGAEDRVVKLGHSRRMHQALKSKGFDVEYQELPDVGHSDLWPQLDDPALYQWLAQQRIPERPRRVTFRTFSPQYDGAYWVRIEQFLDATRPAVVDARRDEDGRVHLKLENVAAFRLTLPGVKAEDVVVEPDDYDLREQTRKAVRQDDGSYRFVAADAPLSISGRHRQGQVRWTKAKHPRRCGPMRTALSRPFLIVYGTQGAEAENDHLQETAENFAEMWYQFAKGRPRVVADSELQEEDRAGHNLLVFGTPRTCSILAPLADGLPVQWVDDDRTVLIGPRRYSMKDRGLIFCAPDPMHPCNTLVINCGRPHGKDLPINHKLDHIPDLLLYGAPVAGATTNDPVAAAVFGTGWELRPEEIWVKEAER